MTSPSHRTSVMPMQKRRRIVLTGGPGGGKTTTADRLRRLWSRHPRFMLVPHHHSFLHKITAGLAMRRSIVAQSGR